VILDPSAHVFPGHSTDPEHAHKISHGG